MTRSGLAVFAMAVVVVAGCAGPMAAAGVAGKPFSVVETGIPELQKALADGRLTSRQLVLEYLTRIAIYEDQLKAIITVNPRVMEEAEALDREWALGRIRGAIRARAPTTGASPSPPAAPARASAPRRASGPPTWGPRRPARS